MPYFDAERGFSSKFSSTLLTLLLSVPAISSRAGAIIRQGPHHSAQKSTTTGPVAFSTSDSKVASETLPTAIGVTSFYGDAAPHRECRTYERAGAASRRFTGR